MPSTTFGTIKRRIQMLTGGRLDAVRAQVLAQQKLTEIYESYGWSFLKGQGLLTTVAPKSAGTITLNADTTKVDGTGTSFTSSDVGSYLRVALDVSYYRITAVVGQQLTLQGAYAGSAFTGSTYSVFRHRYSLASDVRKLLDPAFWSRLRETSIQRISELDALLTYSDLPSHFAYAGTDSNGAVVVQIWPTPSAAVAIPYDYLKTLTEPLTDVTVVPLRADVVTYACAADGLYTVMAEASNPQSVSHLLPLAQRYEAKSAEVLASARYADQAVAGEPQGVRDYLYNSWATDAFTVDHDTFVP